MLRRQLLEDLAVYRGRNLKPEDVEILNRMEEFIRRSPHCFDRENLEGHITGSAMVINSTRDAVLLTLHKKLGKWLQLGGHSDGHPLVHETALREAEEESGLAPLKLYQNDSIPFDLDIHEIPARPDVPRHVHYDVRFLVVADDRAAPKISSESNDLRWFSLAEAKRACPEASMQRQFAKLESA